MRLKGIRDGVLEIVSDGQSKYVEPKGYDRVRLLWAFRNFSALPEPVLSARQKKLIERLSHNPELRPHPRMVIIGAVERDFSRYKRPSQSGRGMQSSAASVEQDLGTRAPVIPIPIAPPNAVVDRDQGTRRPRFAPALHQVAGIVKLAPATSVSRNGESRNLNWAISITATWLPVAAVLVLGIASSLRLETESHLPIARTGLLHPPVQVVNSLPADQTASEVGPSPAQPLPAPASSHKQELMGVRPGPVSANATELSRVDITRASARRSPEKTLAEAITTPVTAPETMAAGAFSAQSGQRPSRLLYPNSPPAARFPGKVLLKATVGPAGEVENVTTLEGDPAMATAAASAMKHWRYEPRPGTEFETEVLFHFLAPDVTTIRFLGEKQIR